MESRRDAGSSAHHHRRLRSTNGQGAHPPLSTPSTPTSTPTPTSPPKTVPTPTATAAATEISAEDKQTLLALLGPAATAHLCRSEEVDRVACGRMYAAGSRLVALLQVSLKSMPKTKPYKDFAGELSLFQQSYQTSTNLGCFGKKTPKNPDICQSITGLAALSYLAMTTKLLY